MAKSRKDATREKILNVALALFVRKGYNGTSVDEITHTAELTKGALYGHFKSKAELLLTLIEEFRIRFIQEMINTTDRENIGALDKLHQIVSFNAQFAIENQSLCVLPTFLTFERKEHREFEIALKEVYQEYKNYIAKIIKQGQREGAFRKDLNPDLTAITFIGIHDGTLHQWLLNQDRIDGKQFVKTFRQVFFEGIQSTPPK
ncbi:MAG TPA: TetR/AcrR family transcriptional regulator [Thermodesulfobacteriota bacterium]|nr:TetR/AcrR family transcriptional regulator [Thermodesulfobacteriota bacterium]